MPTIMMNTVVNNGNPKGPRISTEDTASIKKVLNRLSNTLRIPAKIERIDKRNRWNRYSIPDSSSFMKLCEMSLGQFQGAYGEDSHDIMTHP